MFEHDNWLKYLGRDWSLEDELDYCDKVFEKLQPKHDYNFTDEEIDYAVNSWNKGCNNKEEKYPIQRAMNALQACMDLQSAWKKYDSIGRVKLYFGIGNDK